MQKCLNPSLYIASLYFNINVCSNIVSTPVSIALSAICAIAYFHSLFVGTVALCITVSQWEEETCVVIFLLCKDRSLPLWWMWQFQQLFHPPANRSVTVAQWELSARSAMLDALMVTSRGLRCSDWVRPQRKARDSGAQQWSWAAPLGNTHKYVHRMAHHSDNKPAHTASIWDRSVRHPCFRY